jgi:catechol 2,3-dioxygenase-like lactoylglutathione lyase family enzyme
MEMTMLSHTTSGISNVAAARSFYDPMLAVLGLVLKFSNEQMAGWRLPDAERPLFLVTRPFDGKPASTGNGQMIALLADKRSLVDECYSLALRNGGIDEGKPGLRPEYHADYYGAYFRDPDGNKICVCCHEPENASNSRQVR